MGAAAVVSIVPMGQQQLQPQPHGSHRSMGAVNQAAALLVVDRAVVMTVVPVLETLSAQGGSMPVLNTQRDLSQS